jgi:hypothetical protein
MCDRNRAAGCCYGVALCVGAPQVSQSSRLPGRAGSSQYDTCEHMFFGVVNVRNRRGPCAQIRVVGEGVAKRVNIREGENQWD